MFIVSIINSMFICLELFHALRVSYKATNERKKVLANDSSFTYTHLIVSKAWLLFFPAKVQ